MNIQTFIGDRLEGLAEQAVLDEGKIHSTEERHDAAEHLGTSNVLHAVQNRTLVLLVEQAFLEFLRKNDLNDSDKAWPMFAVSEDNPFRTGAKSLFSS